MSHPCSLCRWASYQARGPCQGWWEFTASRVNPSAERRGDTARAFEPRVVSSPSASLAAAASPLRETGRTRVGPISSRRIRSRSKNRGMPATKPATTSLPSTG